MPFQTDLAEPRSAIVLGAGITGMTVAYGLRARGFDVLLLDTYERAGGNHTSDEIDGMSFDIGAIFHWSHSPLFSMFPDLREQTVPVEWRTDRINPQGQVVAYPFEAKTELWGGSPVQTAKILASLIKHRILPNPKTNTYDFLTRYLGKELIQTSGLDQYVERLYGKPAQEINYEFAQARLMDIANTASLTKTMQRLIRRALRQSSDTRAQCLARPKSGFADFYGGAIEALERDGVKTRFGVSLKAIRRDGDKLVVETNRGPIQADRLVNTMPLKTVGDLAGLDTQAAPVSLPLNSLYWRFRGELGFIGPVLYNFQNTGEWKRLTLHSQYYGEVDGWSYFSTETTVRAPHMAPIEACETDFRASIKTAPILQGELERVGSRTTPFAYPLYDHGAAERRAKLMAALTDFGIECVGRQGAFEYLPVTGTAIKKARDFLSMTDPTSA